MSIVLRYVDVESSTIYERFLSFVHAHAFDAATFCTYILDILQKYGLDRKHLVSQGYDGASMMSGKHSGLQKRIKDVAPQVYTAMLTA